MVPRKSVDINLSSIDINMLLELSRDTRNTALAKRANVILECAKGLTNKEVSTAIGMSPVCVAHWRNAFATDGIEGLRGSTNRGHNQFVEDEDASLDSRLDELLCQKDRHWTVEQLIAELHSTRGKVYGALKRKNISLQRTRQWVIPTQDELVPKTVDIVGLYVTKSEQGLVVCCSQQPMPTFQGNLITRNRLLYEDFSAYKDPLSLSDAIKTAAFRVSDISKQGRLPLSVFLDQTMAAFPDENNTEYHVLICSSETTTYRGQRINKLYQAWTDSPEQWLQLVEQKINELGDRTQDNVPRDLCDALHMYMGSCLESTYPLMWCKTPAEAFYVENQQQEVQANVEGSRSENTAKLAPVFDGTEHSPLLDDLRQVLQSHLITDDLDEDSVRSGFISFAMDHNEVRIQIDTDQGNEIKPSILSMDSIESSTSCLSTIEDKILEIRNRAGVHAAEITADLVKKKLDMQV